MKHEIQLITQRIMSLPDSGRPLLIALDGRCASGKTTLSQRLAEELSCAVIHADDFFLRPEQRTAERMEQAGGNIDYERLLEEVILPLKKGMPFSYRPYSCEIQALAEPVEVIPRKINLIEGSYCCHPTLWEHYDMRIFMTAPKDLRLRRIAERNGDMLSRFENLWIPLEEKYFSAFDIEQRCDVIINCV